MLMYSITDRARWCLEWLLCNAISAAQPSPVFVIADTVVYSRELNRCLSGHTCIPQLVDMESDLCPTRHSRQYSPVARTTPKKHNDQDYVSKAFFIYFLLDPRLSCNLPLRSAADSLSEVESLQQFLKSVFYIGKGKRSRPFAHLHDAAKYSSSSSNNHANHHNGRRQGENGARNAGAGHHPKLDKINEIWTSGLGVVQFSCFQGCTTEEAHNREACCLDAVGLVNLTNKVSGTYYGEFASKSGMERRKMGIHLLAKACRIFLQEGERQYRSNAPVT
ncbi:ankyrin repeat and LEM domain-containing protein 1-like isoform X2 [Sycon ciliatum]|uniref:ankyrin repeat and LEM domain-containing protein 1-like isoform X2 n=1 Tax=Sycon ciliatum TaxID=27933 RepID=UPI0031F66798